MSISLRQRLSPAVKDRELPATPSSGAQRLALQGVLLSAALNAAGQLLFKEARGGHLDASFVALLFHWEMWAGLVLYGLSAVCWLWVLSKAHLSFAYPILSLTFPIVVGLSAVLFAENVPPLRWLGVIVIALGVSLLARSRR